MKNLSVLFLIGILCLSGCAADIMVTDYDVIYEMIMDYHSSINEREPYEDIGTLLYDENDYHEFYQSHFDEQTEAKSLSGGSITLDALEDDKALICLQFEGEKLQCDTYVIDHISISKGIIIVEVVKDSLVTLRVGEDFNGIFYDLKLIEIDRALVTEDTEVEIIILETP